MLIFDIDPRDSLVGIGSCDTCCCKSASMRPGETNKWQINYAPWSLPIGGKGLSVNTYFDIVKLETNLPASAGNQPPMVSFLGVLGDYNTPIIGDVSPSANDPDVDPMIWSLLPMYGPKHGVVVMSAAGAFVYTPNNNFTGYDNFYYQVDDGVNNPVVAEVGIAVSPALPLPPLVAPTTGTPIVFIKKTLVSVNNNWHTLSFPVQISPEALPGDVYRVTVRQQTLDCDCNAYYHVSCYDILIGKCR